MPKKKNKTWHIIISLFLAITLSWVVWKSWDKFNSFIGDNNIVYFVAIAVVVAGVLGGYLTVDGIKRRLG